MSTTTDLSLGSFLKRGFTKKAQKDNGYMHVAIHNKYEHFSLTYMLFSNDLESDS